MPPPPPAGATRPRYDAGWRIAVVYFGLISFGFAQPVFNAVSLSRTIINIDLAGVFLIVFVCQYAAAAALTGLRFLLWTPRLRRGLDFLTVTAALLMAARQVERIHLSFEGFSFNEKLLILAGAVLFACFTAAVLRRFAIRGVFYAGLMAPVFGAVFIYGMMTHSLPLGKSAAQKPESRGPAVMLVVMDEFSLRIMQNAEGVLDAEKFPNFTRLASRGIWWRNAMSNYMSTTVSFPSFLRSKLFAEKTPSFDFEISPKPGLHDIFHDAGYGVHFYSDYLQCGGSKFNCMKYLDVDKPSFLLDVLSWFIADFAPHFMVRDFYSVIYGRQLHAQNDLLVKTAETAAAGNFHLLHLSGTHTPFVFFPDGSYKRAVKRQFLLPDDDFEKFAADYYGQIRYMDTVIGRMLDAAENRPKNNPLILMLTADHGVCWTDNCPGRNAPDRVRTVMPSLVNIPAVLLSRLYAPRVDEDDFQLIDLAPTLCEAAGLKGCGDHGFEGVSRLANPPPQRPRHFFLTPDRPPIDIPLPARPVRLD